MDNLGQFILNFLCKWRHKTYIYDVLNAQVFPVLIHGTIKISIPNLNVMFSKYLQSDYLSKI